MTLCITRCNIFNERLVITVGSSSGIIISALEKIGRDTILGIFISYEGSSDCCWPDLLVDDGEG